jgi:hypothetical protein
MTDAAVSTGAAFVNLLAWIDEKPRTYAETMDAWRTSCPRLSIWEDAVIAGLVKVNGVNVAVTPKGRALARLAPALSRQPPRP